MLRIQRFRVMTAIASGLVFTGMTVAAQSDLVTYHDLGVMPRWSLGNMQVKGVMGQSGSFGIAEMPTGGRGRAGNAHHHTQEQIVLGLNGSPMVLVGNILYRLGTYGALVTPPNVEHANLNGTTAGTSTFIEFQPVLRRDWFPPHPANTSSKSPAPAAISPDQRIFVDFGASSDQWNTDNSGARSKVLGGLTIRLTMLDLSAPKASVTLRPNGEQFVYVLEGQAEMAVGSSRREIKAETLAVVSQAARDVRLGSLDRGRTIVAVFEGQP